MVYRICFIDSVVIQDLFSINKFVLDVVKYVYCGPGLFVYKPNLFSGN